MKKLIFIFSFFHASIFYSQNLTTEGQNLIDDQNNNVILRGINLGGWMLQEPYLLQFTGAANSQNEFKEKLIEFIGQENTENFYYSWYENFITQADVDSIASFGFNSIRLPIHYNLFTLPIQDEPVLGEHTWLDLGFSMVDNLLDWCEANSIYLILDLHAAPGGQGSGSDINDYNPSLPSLWESSENKNKTIALWGKIAERYKDEPWIGGYDLLNETHWSLQEYELRNLYIDITDEIRIYDNNHIIFIEGNWYANDFSGLTPPWDDNLVYSFHKYWSYNDSLDWVTWIRSQFNIPLWMGEAGENSNQWFTESIKVFEENNIGWAFWPWKKLESISAPFSFDSNLNYDNLVNYFRDEVSAPSIQSAVDGLMELAEDSHISNNKYQKDVTDAMLRQPNSSELIPFSQNSIPGIINASDYDLGTQGISYYDKDFATYHVSTNEFQAWNQGWQYRNDGVDIQNNSDADGNGFHIAFTDSDEWLIYTVDVENTGYYNLITRYSGEYSGNMSLLFNDQPIAENIYLYSTGNWNNFINKLTPNIYLTEGNYKFKVYMNQGGYNLYNFNFLKSQNIPDFAISQAYTIDNYNIGVLLNQPILSGQDFNNSIFGIKIDDNFVDISSINIDQQNNRILLIESTEQFSFASEIKLTNYTSDQILSGFDEYLPEFNDFPVFNNLEDRHLIPGIIQVEDFIDQDGYVIEDCYDVGGGFNFGYTDVGDYAKYQVLVEETGQYEINFRVASEWQGGIISLKLEDGIEEYNLTNISVPITGGWQNWQTTTSIVNINEGAYTLTMTVNQPGFNINWIEFDYLGNSMGLEESTHNKLKIYPNPTSRILNIRTLLQNYKVEVFDLMGKKIYESFDDKFINIDRYENGIYLLKISSSHQTQSKLFIKN
ncbi:MAG: glycoside hydrolase family 5 [Flavobacteriaceae bacterium]|nr:glycoside hydrolase family 5 [Flavobacteriaceae bacterium]